MGRLGHLRERRLDHVYARGADDHLGVRRTFAQAYSVEAANVRHEHEWHVWDNVKLPEGRSLVPGVVSHHTNLIEHPQLVADRIVRLARLVGRDNVVAGTDCGFSPGPFQRRFHPSIMWAKLETLVAGAKLATKELWGNA